jgi:hypothetical protein
MEEWLREARAVLEGELVGEGWQIVEIPANAQNFFSARDVHARVASTEGPVAVVGSVQSSALAELRDRLITSRSVIACTEPAESTDVYECLREAVDAHVSGQPHVPARLAAALFVLRKLWKRARWGGAARNKGYDYADELCNGGVPPELHATAREVANTLHLHGILGSKKSNRRLKYCLNADRRAEVFELLDCRRASNERTRNYLFGGKDTISVRVFDGYLDEVTPEEDVESDDL